MKPSHRTRWILAVTVVGVLAWGPDALARDWPQEITAPEGKIVVYQPQPEKLAGNLLTGRAAVSLEIEDHEEPVFGAMWFSARIDTDQDAGVATVRDVSVTKVSWPDSKDAGEQRFTKIVEDAVPDAGFEISLDRLSASLANAELEQESLDQIKNDPPKVVFREHLAVLLLYDGQPRFEDVDDSGYERALNTAFVVVRHKKSGVLYLSSGVLWYQARDPLGPWSPIDDPPSDLVKLLPAPDADEPAPKTPPEIVCSTEPTELIATDGKPSWMSLPGGELLYVQNTESPWLRELSTGNMYILLSGRWYRAKTEDGPWTFVRSDELPASFQDIPPDSDIGGLRVSVAGTDEAEDAMLDAAIPQTAAIKRSEAKLEVDYDGDPKFEAIPGTSVAYAVNTGAQVLRIDDRFYAVDDGVWFTSTSAEGPWSVADSIPEDEIAKIPPSSPVYNTTYVHVYESTPEVVYVGYTPGYMGSYPYYGVPVYGTGWYYPPYWGRYYYPRPCTWGFHVGYNPWTGWNFGVSWSNGFFSFGVSWGGGYGPHYRPWGCCGGWYGGGYRRPVVINTGDINIGNSINVGNQANVRNRVGDTNLANDRDRTKNLYNRPENRARNAEPAVARQDLQQARSAGGRKNDVYADRNGNVARRAGDDWQTREGGKWQPPDKPSTKSRDRSNPAPSPGGGLDRSGLDRSYRARQSGSARERSRPASRPSAPRGGRRR